MRIFTHTGENKLGTVKGYTNHGSIMVIGLMFMILVSKDNISF